MALPDIDDATRYELEAAAFRGLIAHLDSRRDVQNIQLMELAGFCRNCLAKWYAAAAAERGITISKEDSREITHCMPYDVWKRDFQK